MPYDARTAVLPSPVTSHARPTRGEKLSHCLLMPEPLSGKPGSPGYISPAGALRNRLLLTPAAKFSNEKFSIAPFRMFSPRYGSHRRPALMVIRSVVLHVSCAYTPR